MSTLDLAAIRERAEAATPGPWEWQPPSGEAWPIADESLLSPGTGEYVLVGWGYDASGIDGETADREFIAHAREDIPALLDEIDRLNAIIQRVREIEREMDEYSHRSGPCTGVNCGGCQAGRFSTALRRALEGGDS